MLLANLRLNSKLSFLAVLLLGLFIRVPLVFAASQQLSLEEQHHYNMTYESCKLFLAEATLQGAVITYLNPQAVDVMLSSFGDINHMINKYFEGDTNAFQRLNNNRGLGVHMKTLLYSEGFSAAMRDCFPDNEFYHQAYVADLLLFDAIGTYATVGAYIYGYFKFLAWSYTHIHLPWVKALFLGHVSMNMTSSSVQNKKSLPDMMAEQYQSLSSQVEALLKKEQKKN